MRLDTRPLLETAPDADLFVDRKDELERVLRAAASDLNTLILGDRGIGKTSLLRHAAYHLHEESRNVVVVDAGLTDSPEGVLLAVESALGRNPHAAELLQSGFQRAVAPPRAPGSRALEIVRRLGTAGRAIVMLDNLPSPNVGHVLFGRLRDEMWRLPHTWVVAANESDLRTLLAPPADAFFALTVHLKPFGGSAARKLLARRLDRGQGGLASELAKSGEGNPRKLLELARRVLIEGVGPASAGRLLERRVRAETSAAELGRPHSMLFAELLAMGSASPSDAGLLDRVGWSRPRANQVLRELEREGLAVAQNELINGAGKPR